MGALNVLVERWGRAGFALASSLAWGLPLAVWAGSFDIGPPKAWPWYFFWAGLALLALWCGLLVRLRRVPVTPRPRRLDLRAMTAAERRWYALFAVCLVGAIGWLNAAATVDLGALLALAARGSAGAAALAAGLGALLVALVGGAVAGWRRASAATMTRLRT